MQQLTTYRPQHATTLPEAIIVARNATSFLPANVYFPAIAGTSIHAALIVVHQVVQDQNIASMIMQYTEDASTQLIKRGVVPKLRVVSFMQGRCMTAWSTHDGRYIYISATFNDVYMMLDGIFDWMQMSIEASGFQGHLRETQLNAEKLKRVVLAGNTRTWFIHTNYIMVETTHGYKQWRILFNNFWIWFNSFLEINSDYTHYGR